jgi:biopolymer transport protein TolR
MAGISTEGEEKLNVELNIVPFIDLLSTLVLFLLVTAVWLQVGAIPASVDSKGKSANTFSEQKRLQIHVTAQGYRLTWPSHIKGLTASIAKTQSGYDRDRLIALLSQAVKSKNLTAVAVSADDSIEYGAVAQAIDAAKSGQILFVALSTN